MITSIKRTTSSCACVVYVSWGGVCGNINNIILSKMYNMVKGEKSNWGNANKTGLKY